MAELGVEVVGDTYNYIRGKDTQGDILWSIGKTSSGLDDINITNIQTGTYIKLDENGNPQYTIHENVAWDHLHWDKSLAKIVTKLDAVCFGSLIQRNWDAKKTILKFLKIFRYFVQIIA